MNWRYRIGQGTNLLRTTLLSRPWFPLTRAVRLGGVWPYDVARLAGTRRLATVVDVGANIGQSANLLRRFFPAATIHSVEPVPGTFALLQRNTRGWRNVRPHCLALGDHNGVVHMTADSGSETNAIVAAPRDAGTCAVPMQTLDTFAREKGIAEIDILKIDVEGHELAVLAGADGLLRARRIRCVYAEVAFEAEDHGHTLFDVLRSRLTGHGFGFAGLYEPWRYPECRGRIGFANALFWRLNAATP